MSSCAPGPVKLSNRLDHEWERGRESSCFYLKWLGTTTVSYSGRSRGIVPRLPLSLWLVFPLRIALSRFRIGKPSTAKSATEDRDRGTTPEVLLFSSEVVLFCSEVLPQPLRLRKFRGEEGLWPRSQIFERNGTTSEDYSQGTTPGSTIGVVPSAPAPTTGPGGILRIVPRSFQVIFTCGS